MKNAKVCSKDKELCFVGRESQKLKGMRSSVNSLFVRVKGESQQSSLEAIAWQPDGRAIFGWRVRLSEWVMARFSKIYEVETSRPVIKKLDQNQEAKTVADIAVREFLPRFCSRELKTKLFEDFAQWAATGTSTTALTTSAAIKQKVQYGHCCREGFRVCIVLCSETLTIGDATQLQFISLYFWKLFTALYPSKFKKNRSEVEEGNEKFLVCFEIFCQAVLAYTKA